MSKTKLGWLLLGLWLVQSFIWHSTALRAQSLPTQCIASAIAGGTANAITITALPCATTTNLVIVTASAANSSTSVTLQVIGQTLALPVVKGLGVALAVGDIPGANYRMQLTPTGSSWVLMNPSTAGTLTSVTCGAGLTCTPNPIVLSGTIASASAASAPGGRLTLVTGTPVLTSNQTGKSQIFYDCYMSAAVPYYTGVTDGADTIAGCEVSLTMATSGTGVTNSAGVFDIWWVHGGASRICVATNGSGGGWASDGGSNITRGVGYSQVHNTRGYWTNVNSIASCYNGTSNYGPVSADQGTYLGTLTTTAAGQTGMNFIPSAASGGVAPVLGLWNAYWRQPVSCVSRDSKASWTTTSTSFQALDGGNNSCSWVDGLAQSAVSGALNILANSDGTASTFSGMDLDSVSTTPQQAASGNVAGTAYQPVTDTWFAQIGLHTVNAVQASSSGAHTATFYGLSGVQVEGLIIGLVM